MREERQDPHPRNLCFARCVTRDNNAQMSRETLSAPTATGELRGWVEGDGEPVVLLHGGPGLSYGYLDAIAADIGPGCRIAAYQQRGLAPSTTDGPFGIAEEIADFVAVLDALGWEKAWAVGHSWGGHLALRLAAAHPERLHGILAIDPIGIVGDGGMSAFEAEMVARMPKALQERMAVLIAREQAGEATAEDALEGLAMYWPSYFADPDRVPPPPDLEACVQTQAAIFPQMVEGLPEVAEQIAAGELPVGLLAGAGSPVPWGVACRAIANLSERIQLTVIPAAGHFVWFEAPGSTRRALRRLQGLPDED
jgi:pimeloyl-ACP methyl ester carboxylesterase